MRETARAVRIDTTGISAEFDPGRLELQLDVCFIHQEVDGAYTLPLGKYEIERGRDPILALCGSDVRQPFANPLAVLRLHKAEDEHAFRRSQRTQVFPIRLITQHFR